VALGLVAALGAVLAALGAAPMVDHMTHRVFVLVDSVAWSDAWRPLWMPPPVMAWSVRPGAVVLTKLHTALFGPLVAPPVWELALGAWASLLLFGAGGWAWLRAHGLPRVALPAALGSMLLAPALFSAWYLPEYDALGAGLVLLGGARLAVGGRGAAGGVALLSAAVLLKESSALVVFALLAASTVVRARDRDRPGAARHGLSLLALLGGFIALAAPALGSGASLNAAVPLALRLPIVELNAHQLLYLVGPAGAALGALGPVVGRWPRRAAFAGAAAVAALALLPPLHFYSHYEAAYYGPRAVASGLGVALVVGLLGAALGGGRADGRRHAAAALLSVYGAFTLAALFAASAREDIAARVLLAGAPMLFALALDTCATLWRGPARGAAGLLGAALAVYPLVGAFDFTQDWRARQATEADARSRLAQDVPLDGILAFNHYVQWVGPHELRAAGAPAGVVERTAFVQVAAWQPTDALPRAGWGRGTYDLEQAWRVGVPLDLYWLAARADPPTETLVPDLAWTRRPMGLFTPLADQVAGGGGGPQAPHNLPEDMVWTTYRPGPTPLEAVAAARADVAWEITTPFAALPRDLLSLPRRIVAGSPLLERYHYEARRYRFVPPEGVAPQRLEAAEVRGGPAPSGG
jgi:hypothetical protein